MTTSGNDQSASVRCYKHGRTAGGVFFRPEPNEGCAADYLCLHCWLEIGAPKSIERATFEQVKYSPRRDNPDQNTRWDGDQ